MSHIDGLARVDGLFDVDRAKRHHGVPPRVNCSGMNLCAASMRASLRRSMVANVERALNGAEREEETKTTH